MSPSSAPYAFRPGENIPGEFVRLLGVLSDQASDLIPCPPEALPQGVHRARTLIKRARSMLWFALPLLAPADAARLRTQLRQAAQFLAASRDLTVIQATLKKLARSASQPQEREALALLSEKLNEKPSEPSSSDKVRHDPLLKAVQFLLLALDEMARIARTSRRTWPFPSERLAQAFLIAHKAGKKARRLGTAHQFHDWRKKVKRLLHQLELIHGKPDQATRRTTRQIDRLQEKLGVLHDCSITEQRLRKKIVPREDTLFVLQLLEKRKVRLREKALKIADSL